MILSQSSAQRLDLLQKTTTQRTGAKCNLSLHSNLFNSFSWQTMITLVAVLLVFSVEAVIGKEFTNEWAVEVPEGDVAAELLASEHGFINLGRIMKSQNIFHFRHNDVVKRSLEANFHHHDKLINHEKVTWAEQQRIKRRVKRDATFDPKKGPPSDPLWKKMWYMLPTTHPNMKIVEAWKQGFTGKGVVVTILDDGIEYSHPDLAKNYDKLASSDINSNDDDPKPRPTYDNENRHGTRCAGEVAAVANNNVCSVGIAYNAYIGGVRMLDGPVTDVVECRSISLRPEHIDIYSASWGPDDDGKTVDGPARLAKQAFQEGVRDGRGGKGSIFVWASGNGGKKEDNCNCDGYTNSIFTLSISSATQHREKPWYSESCSSTLATTYSSGTSTEAQIVTTDLGGRCTELHTGTSASAPLAAGICALALEANNNLTWRDMQHLVVQTANPRGLHVSDWVTNGAGRNVSHAFGYGLMDASAMVSKAQNWVFVPQQRTCKVTVLTSPRTFSVQNPLEVTKEVTKCDDGSPMPDLLEHVQAVVSLRNDRRGDLAIYLKSPMGTESTLLQRRRLDYSSQGFDNWPFMTTHNWYENPIGTWTLEIDNTGSSTSVGTLTSYSLILHGTLMKDWPKLPDGIQVSFTTKSITTSTFTTTQRSQSSKATTGTTTVHVSSKASENCKTVLRVGTGCLVCKDGFVRSPDKNTCLTECPAGYFIGYEKVQGDRQFNESKRVKDENTWENKQSEGFEEEERFYGSRICLPCGMPYCMSCFGSEANECYRCLQDYELTGDKCVLASESKLIYKLTVAVCILSVILFFTFFAFLHFCKHGCNCLSRKPLYNYVRNGYDPDLDSDSTEVAGFKNHYSKKNGLVGAKKSLLSGSDEE